MTERTEAKRLNEEGLACNARGDPDGAERAHRESAAADPSWSVPVYNLGLLFKYQGRWVESLEYNQRAAELAPDDEAAWWNLGIAATALGQWADARRAWRGCGIEVPDGEGPPDLELGHIPVRLDPVESGEVVWTRRIDPARAQIESVPLPTSRFHWGDVVLTDGAKEGYRVVNGQSYPVFNVLERLEESLFRTFIVELATMDAAAIDTLVVVAEALGGAAENWGTSTRILCDACSLGTPHWHADQSGSPAHPHCGVAARDRDHADEILRQWLAGTPSADVVTWYEAPLIISALDADH